MELIRIVDEVSGQLSDDASKYQILHGLELANLSITHAGQPKLTGLKPKIAETAHSPVTGLIKILKSIVPMCPKSIRVDGENILTEMMFERLLQSAKESISKLESQVEREFFRTYKADESSHGQKRWEELVLAYLPSHRTDEQQLNHPEVRDKEPEKGEFTRALESRHGPVMPQPLTFADRVTGVETSVLYEKEPAKLIPEKDNFFFPSEWASSYLLCTEDQSEKLKVEKQARILASHQTSFQGVYMRRNLKRETVVQVVDACLKKAKLKFNDLDLVVFDNVDKDKSQIGALVTLREGGKTKLLTPSLFLGHPICANGGAMITTALMCLKHQKIFSSYLDSVPDEPELTAEEEEMNLNRILVLSQGLNNSLHGLILEKA